ncbi:MAG: hypothetical protein AAB525_00605 [Patescibacteria group bacterium]
MNYKKIMLAGSAAGIVHIIFGTLTCGWLFKGIYLIEPTNVWKFTGQSGFSGSQIAIMTIGNIVIGVILAGAYAWLKAGIPGAGIKKGLNYGLALWLVGTLPGMFSTYMFMTVATAVVLYWIVIGLVNYLILGVIIAKIYKENKDVQAGK